MSYVCLWSPGWSTGAGSPTDENRKDQKGPERARYCSTGAACSAELIGALLARAPRIVVAENGRVWADARGMDLRSLATSLLEAAREHGLADVRAGAATTAIAAELAVSREEEKVSPSARRSVSPAREEAVTSGDALTVVRIGTDREFISLCSLALLNPSVSLAGMLEGIGVTSCGDLASLDAEQVEVRLGVEGVALWRLARADEKPWLFRAPLRGLPSSSLEWSDFTLADPERLLFIINSLLEPVCNELVVRGLRAREIELDFALANRRHAIHPLRAARPSADRRRWMRLVRDALERIVLADSVTAVDVRVVQATGNEGVQGDLFDRGFASAEAVEDSLAALVDDQGEVLVEPNNSRHPLVDQRTIWKAVEPESVARRVLDPTKPAAPALSLQLHSPPQPIRVVTRPRRDHRMPIRYRDSRGWHNLVEAAGPDRVSGAGWEEPFAREYFRCVREDGAMVWMYRGDAAKAPGTGVTRDPLPAHGAGVTRDPLPAHGAGVTTHPSPAAESGGHAAESQKKGSATRSDRRTETWYLHGWWD
jgi:hypothetical protein